MNWGWFFLWLACIFVLFFVTGWPVSPHLADVWGNHYDAKDLTYYAVLYIHYLLGPLIFTFLGLGLFRNFIWTTGDSRQLIFLLAYSVLLASMVAVFLTHQYAPPDLTMVEAGDKETSAVPMEDMNATAAEDTP
jgi:Na+-driven multidrug efflux pump